MYRNTEGERTLRVTLGSKLYQPIRILVHEMGYREGMCDKLTIQSSLNLKKKERERERERKEGRKEGKRERRRKKKGKKRKEKIKKKALTTYLLFSTSLEALCHILLSVVGIIKT